MADDGSMDGRPHEKAPTRRTQLSMFNIQCRMPWGDVRRPPNALSDCLVHSYIIFFVSFGLHRLFLSDGWRSGTVVAVESNPCIAHVVMLHNSQILLPSTVRFVLALLVFLKVQCYCHLRRSSEEGR